MPKITVEHIDGLFKPDIDTGISEWKTRAEIHSYDSRLISGDNQSKNGNNHRNGVWWGIDKYEWDTKRHNNKCNLFKTFACEVCGIRYG